MQIYGLKKMANIPGNLDLLSTIAIAFGAIVLVLVIALIGYFKLKRIRRNYNSEKDRIAKMRKNIIIQNGRVSEDRLHFLFHQEETE